MGFDRKDKRCNRGSRDPSSGQHYLKQEYYTAISATYFGTLLIITGYDYAGP